MGSGSLGEVSGMQKGAERDSRHSFTGMENSTGSNPKKGANLQKLIQVDF
jgi:hypothetical protein